MAKTMKMTRAMKEVQNDFPRWVLESTVNGQGQNLVHQFWCGGNLRVKVEEMWDQDTGEYLGYSSPFCYMWW